MLSKEHAEKIKQQIIKQIDSWHASEEQKQEAKKQIADMPEEQLEDFLIKNKLIKPQEQEEQPGEKIKETTPSQCPFCLITQSKIHTFKIDENKNNIAVLEINPLSKGHTIIIPKKHVEIEKASSQAFSLAKKTARKLKSKLRAREISIQTANAFGHGIINLIPLYENEKLERKKAAEGELKQLQEKLTSKKAVKKPKIKISKKQIEKAPRRIP